VVQQRLSKSSIGFDAPIFELNTDLDDHENRNAMQNDFLAKVETEDFISSGLIVMPLLFQLKCSTTNDGERELRVATDCYSGDEIGKDRSRN